MIKLTICTHLFSTEGVLIAGCVVNVDETETDGIIDKHKMLMMMMARVARMMEQLFTLFVDNTNFSLLL